eukprot:7377872-Prymnesium_polylepis.2
MRRRALPHRVPHTAAQLARVPWRRGLPVRAHDDPLPARAQGGDRGPAGQAAARSRCVPRDFVVPAAVGRVPLPLL